MKNYYQAIGILLVINLIVTAAFVSILPDQVPAHFGQGGEVDRIGSKYWNFALFALALGVGILSIADARTTERGNTKTMLKIAVAGQVFFAELSVYFALNQLAYEGSAAPAMTIAGLDMSQISVIGLGILLIVFGNLMPKTTRNFSLGIRPPWAMESEEVWRKTQRFSGMLLS